jgi:hypothetical protein
VRIKTFLGEDENMSKIVDNKALLQCFDGLCGFLAVHGFTKRDENAVLIRKILENIWVEGEPGHEEYHIHPKAFE